MEEAVSTVVSTCRGGGAGGGGGGGSLRPHGANKRQTRYSAHTAPLIVLLVGAYRGGECKAQAPLYVMSLIVRTYSAGYPGCP